MENGKGYVDGFFRWAWRINGLLLLALVLYGAALQKGDGGNYPNLITYAPLFGLLFFS